MSNPKPSLVFFGNERLATGVTTTVPIIKSLLAKGYEILAVVSNYSAFQSPTARSLEIKTVAEANGIPIWLPDKLSDIKPKLESLGAEVGILAAYGKIVPQNIINCFPKGIINLHPSLLPLHRGPIPIESVILHGAKHTGISLMQLAKAMDAGPIFAQSSLELSGQETKQELADKLLEIGSAMLVELLPQILAGEIIGMPQDETKATYDNLIVKQDGLIDWQKPAVQLEREVRAYAGWPNSQTTIGNQRVIVLAARVEAGNSRPGKLLPFKNRLVVGCRQGALEIIQLQPLGKRPMSAKDFINGYGQALQFS